MLGEAAVNTIVKKRNVLGSPEKEGSRKVGALSSPKGLELERKASLYPKDILRTTNSKESHLEMC